MNSARTCESVMTRWIDLAHQAVHLLSSNDGLLVPEASLLPDQRITILHGQVHRMDRVPASGLDAEIQALQPLAFVRVVESSQNGTLI